MRRGQRATSRLVSLRRPGTQARTESTLLWQELRETAVSLPVTPAREKVYYKRCGCGGLGEEMRQWRTRRREGGTDCPILISKLKAGCGVVCLSAGMIILNKPTTALTRFPRPRGLITPRPSLEINRLTVGTERPFKILTPYPTFEPSLASPSSFKQTCPA